MEKVLLKINDELTKYQIIDELNRRSFPQFESERVIINSQRPVQYILCLSDNQILCVRTHRKEDLKIETVISDWNIIWALFRDHFINNHKIPRTQSLMFDRKTDLYLKLAKEVELVKDAEYEQYLKLKSKFEGV